MSPLAKRQLEELPWEIQRRIVRDIEKKLKKTPIEFGKPLSGQLHGNYRLRVGSYRVMYEVYQEKIMVHVIRIGHRDGFYD